MKTNELTDWLSFKHKKLMINSDKTITVLINSKVIK